MKPPHRSGCPINLALELLGDRWTLLVIRDIVFGGRRHFRTLLRESEEGIASNLLADRLRRLVDAGLLRREDDPSHAQKALYSLEEPAIQLVPLLVRLGVWGLRHAPASPEIGLPARMLDAGGPEMQAALMDQLRHVHLGAPAPARDVGAELRAARAAETDRPAPPPGTPSGRRSAPPPGT